MCIHTVGSVNTIKMYKQTRFSSVTCWCVYLFTLRDWSDCPIQSHCTLCGQHQGIVALTLKTKTTGQTLIITNKPRIFLGQLLHTCGMVQIIYSRHNSYIFKFEFYNFRHDMELEFCTSLSDRTHWRKPVPSLRTMNIRFFPIGNKMQELTCQAQKNKLWICICL